MPSWSVNSVWRHGSIQVSLDSEDRLVKRGLTTEWTAHYVRLFEKVRKEAFTAQADQLRTHFNAIQNGEDKLSIARTIFTKEFLASQQKVLAEQIEKAMADGHFKMPSGHEKWYHIAWHDRRTPGEDATAYHAELYIQMMFRWLDSRKTLCASHLHKRMGGFDYNKVVTEPTNSDEQADARSVVSDWSDAPTAVGDEPTIDPPSSHLGGSVLVSTGAADQSSGRVDPSFGRTAAWDAPLG